MPTGYTAPVKDGDVTELPDYMSRVAHAFIIDLRDSASDSPLPSPGEYKPNEYTTKAYNQAIEKRDKLLSMTDAEAKVQQQKEWDEGKTAHDEYKARQRVTLGRYSDMLEKVQAWVPPTSRHTRIKEFAVSQLEDSIKFDCGGVDEEFSPLTKSVDEWRTDLVGYYNRLIDSYAEDLQKSEDRFYENKAWIEDFKKSLNIA